MLEQLDDLEYNNQVILKRTLQLVHLMPKQFLSDVLAVQEKIKQLKLTEHISEKGQRKRNLCHF